jgi:hypothetical protein
MTCSKYQPMLSRLLDRELSPWETAEVEGHLAQCGDCRTLMEHYRLQGVYLRNHLGRYRLGDDFVKKVLQAVPPRQGAAGSSLSNASGGKSLARWIPAAAAILVAAVALTFYFTNRNSIGYARVIDPAALEVLQSSAWVRATAGELLHPGDWLRNPVPGAPEIMWRDSCRLTLEAGTLAQIPESRVQPPDQIVLISGSLSSEIQAGSREFLVRTPAGTVSSFSGRFTVRATDLVVPQLSLLAGGGETLTGTVVPIGEVHVGDGKARILAARAAREVLAGATAVFTASEFATAASRPKTVEANLRIVSAGSEQGTMATSLAATEECIWIDVEASNISLKRLLELTTGSEVRGGEDTNVAGTLRFPAQSSANSVALAVGSTLGLPISYRQEKARQTVAFGPLNPAQSPDWVKGEFTFKRSPTGRISFNFQTVPAGQVFQVLRSAVTDLPELSADAGSIPVTLQASDLDPAETSAWVGRALGLEFRTVDFQSSVIEVGIPTTGAPMPENANPGRQRVSDPQVSPIGNAQADEKPRNQGGDSAAMAMPDPIQQGQALVAMDSQSRVALPQGAVVDSGMSMSGFFAASVPAAGDRSELKGKTSPKKRQFFGAASLFAKPEPSTHLIWPTLGLENAAGAETAYLVTNNVELPAHTLWYGYDREGDLIAQYEIPVNGSSTLSLLPTRDLPSFLDAGGHWETVSNIPLVGSRESGSGDGIGIPVGSDHLTRQWAFPSAWLSLGARLWIANPSEQDASVVVAVVRNGRTVATEQLLFGPHGGSTWPELPSSIGAGMTVVVYVLQGSAASGLK